MSSSDSEKNSLESTKKLIPFPRNWNESTENMNLPERDENCNESGKNMNVISVMSTENWYESCKDMSLIGKTKSGIEEELRAPLLASASDDNCCNMAKDKLEEIKDLAEEEKTTEGIDDYLDFLIKAGGVLLLAPAIGYFGGIGSACGFILDCAASNDSCRKMAEEMIRGIGISDEHRDLVVKGARGALFLASAKGFLGGACGSIFGGGSPAVAEKLMKAPGRPGEFIARAAFEANPKAYFRALRGKYP